MYDLRTLTFQDSIFSCVASENVTSEDLLHRGNVFENVIVVGLLEKPRECVLYDGLLDDFETNGPIQCQWDSDSSRVLTLSIPPDFNSRNFFIRFP